MKEMTVTFPAFFFPLSLEIWDLGLHWEVVMESELKNVEGQPPSLLCALQLCRQPCFCLHTVSTPWCTPTACSAWPCSPPVTPDGHRKEKAGKKGTESSGVTRTRCMYSIDFCVFGVLYEVMGKARKNTQEIQQVSFHSTVFSPHTFSFHRGHGVTQYKDSITVAVWCEEPLKIINEYLTPNWDLP